MEHHILFKYLFSSHASEVLWEGEKKEKARTKQRVKPPEKLFERSFNAFCLAVHTRLKNAKLKKNKQRKVPVLYSSHLKTYSHLKRILSCLQIIHVFFKIKNTFFLLFHIY